MSDYKKKQERRQLENNIKRNDRSVEGYAVVFNSQSENLGGFVEIIHPEAITEETINESDVLARFNHNDEKVLARSKKGKGSLTLSLDERGLHYSFQAPRTALGDELLEYIERGDINASSFCFTIAEGGEKWVRENEQLVRHIYKIERLYDIAPVFTPAYEATTCSARALERVQAIEMLEETLNNLLQEVEEM